MDILFVLVHYDVELVFGFVLVVFTDCVSDGTEFELGSCDCDHVSLITLLHSMSEKKTGSEKVPNEEYCVWVFCPWSGERKEVNSDMELVHVFRSFVDHKEMTIRFEVEKKPYISLPSDLRFIEFANNFYNYEGDNEDDDAKSVLSGDSEEVVEVDDVRSEDEKAEAKIARLMKGNPYKKMVGGRIEFELTYECKEEECPWRLHASNMLNDVTMQVKTYNNKHECHRVYRSEKARSKWIASLAIFIHLQEPISTFQRFFISFEAQRLGFIEGCRPFIGIDGCHLKGSYGGVLLSAVALDANNDLFLVAFCICERETLLSWTWFLKTLREFLKCPEDHPICFMSDRQKGVIGALKSEWPTAIIRYCFTILFNKYNLV
ncbi:hypothetical protein EZV62_001201 [Acer yangbiense]|uniref:MULE transposase domain-containing protein n=1 Tax=Acer yangbiense TaxID=1000413 RepID=A0A5C7IVS9_9ROSI|nr:hypothetical protein EZV62_001201 [Acer yangbiense]